MKIAKFIALVLFVVEGLNALKKKQEHCYVDAFWYLGWAIIMYIAASTWRFERTRKDDAI